VQGELFASLCLAMPTGVLCIYTVLVLSSNFLSLLVIPAVFIVVDDVSIIFARLLGRSL
jgi:hypothetical protein